MLNLKSNYSTHTDMVAAMRTTASQSLSIVPAGIIREALSSVCVRQSQACHVPFKTDCDRQVSTKVEHETLPI